MHRNPVVKIENYMRLNFRNNTIHFRIHGEYVENLSNKSTAEKKIMRLLTTCPDCIFISICNRISMMRKTVVTKTGIVIRLFHAKFVKKRKTSPNGEFILLITDALFFVLFDLKNLYCFLGFVTVVCFLVLLCILV